MIANLENPGSKLKNPELLKTIEDLAALKKEVKEGVEPSITKGPERLSNGKILFDYKEKNGQKWEIITEKLGDSYKVRVKKWVKLSNGQMGWQTQKNGNNETFNFTATDKTLFNNGLSNVLNKTIGTNRDKLPKTGGKVYDMLNTSNKKAEQKESNENMPEGLRLDHGVYIYRIQLGDTRSELISKLSKYKPLSYLKEGYGWQGDGANSFNVGNYLPSSKFDKGVDLIVPNKEYTKDASDFKKTQLTAINNMKNNSKYGDKIKKLFQSRIKGGYGYSENDVANAMTAFARSESSREAWNGKIGECALFRYEPSQVFSYGYHHVALSLKNGKTTKNLAGDKALNGLHFTVGETCNPTKSGMLFLAYCIEKCPNDYHKFFNINGNVERCCEHYNGSNWENTNPNYDRKLKNNYKKIKGLK